MELERPVAIKKQVLLVGETWVTSATHIKGFDPFYSATFHSGAGPLIAALRDSDFELTHMSGHDCAAQFPSTLEGLRQYDAIILSDIGANTLLLHPDVWLHSRPAPNRLKLLRDWTFEGGGLIMAGGYLSFQGIDGRARWRGTPVEAALPVTCLPQDDRIEVPDGFHPEVAEPEHPVLQNLSGTWPLLLGANEVTARLRGDCSVLVKMPDDEGGHPLLVVGEWGAGRTAAWMSDISPHWAPAEFVNWAGYTTLWRNILGWITQPK